MAVVAVPRALREKLGDDASDSLVDLLQQFEAEQTDHLIEMVEERFVRSELGKEIGSLRTELGKEIAEVRKEITVQTRWILAVLVAAVVLVPIIQRVMEALLP